MSDIFSLFDGKMGAGSAASISAQSADSFSDVTSENDLVARLASGSDMVELDVDYSDFANFVTFNSAESYVNVTADQILNDYPFDGSVDDLQRFLDSLDGYQRFLLGRWPSRTGHLRLNPSVSESYLRIDDYGVQDGVSKTSFISPGTGSLSVQGWIDVPLGLPNSTVIFQKQKDVGINEISVFVAGTQIVLQVVSGSTLWTTQASVSEMPLFFSAVIDRTSSTGSMSIYTATTGTFPVLGSTLPMITSARFDLASGSFFIGSGSLGTHTTQPFTGSIDSISVWNTVRGLAELTSSYNRKVYAQSGLLGAWRFNEATESTPASYASMARDCSGHRLDGRIQNYFPAIRGSGSLSNDSPDPILSLDDPDVIDFVVDAQSSGSLYDRNNESMILNLFPDAFSQGSETFQNFTLIMARFFDRIKLYIKQLPNLRRIGYSDFNEAPDDLLEDVGALYGWQLDSSFSTTDALKYFVGRDVTGGPQGNVSIDTRLVDIKSKFWRRVLQNLMYLYKTKGTRESVESLLRVYGVNTGFVKLKEYARKSESRVPVSRVQLEKSVYSLAFGISGSSGSIAASGFDIMPSGSFSTELRVKFPGPTNDEIPPTQLIGELVTFYSSSFAQYPLSASEMNTRVGDGTWGSGYLFDEASGYLAPQFGSPFFTGSAGTIYGNAGYLSDSDKSVGLNGLEKLTTNNTDFNVGPADDFLLLWVAKYETGVASPYTIVFDMSNDDNIAATDLYQYANGGGYSATAPSGSDFRGDWHVGMFVIDASTSKSRIGAHNLETGQSLISAEADMTGFPGITSHFRIGGQSDRLANFAAFYYSIGVGVASSISADFQTAIENFALSLQSTVSPASVFKLLYEKESATALTGNLILSSSVGRFMQVSSSIFNGDFYNLSIVKEIVTGSMTLNVVRYESDVELHRSSSVLLSGYPQNGFNSVVIGSYTGSLPEFYGQEFRLWSDSLETEELNDHAKNFESYGRLTSINNSGLEVHWRMNEGAAADSFGTFSIYDSTENANDGACSGFTPSVNSFIKSLFSQAIIPSIDYGWNQEKVRIYDGSKIPAADRYEDERFVSLEFNMYDALNEDISHLIASYSELNNVLGHPMNRYRGDYEGLQQMRETYFKRLHGQLNFKAFAEMLDFFDSSFVKIVQRLIPARSIFKGDELVVESHMLERPKYQYGFRPIREGILDVSGSISMVDRNEDWP